MEISLVILAAGKSSRFGGEPKMLSKVGPNSETLFEISLMQVTKYFNISHLYLVLGPHNEEEIKHAIDKMQLSCFKNCMLTTVVQAEPRGTAHALNTLSNLILTPFILMNSDDLYGEETFKEFSEKIDNESNYVIGYPIGKTLPPKDPANRAFIQYNKEGKVTKLQEKLNLRRSFYSEGELNTIIVSVNLFYLQPQIMRDLRSYVRDEYETTEEIMLPNMMNSMITNKELELKYILSNGDWQGVTYKEDVKSVRLSLKNSSKTFFV